LFQTGHLTVDDVVIREDGDYYTFRPPNKEMSGLFDELFLARLKALLVKDKVKDIPR
jgi:hypothetical protein